jgi:asparagine synthase (glutamine-hydrolysing)
MFAFAIWDDAKQQLFVARDRIGIKPLVYAACQRQFVFASELQALRQHPGLKWTLDYAALDLYLHFQFIPAPFTIYQEARKLPPAHYMIVEASGQCSGPVRYWQLQMRPDETLSEADWVDCLDEQLEESVRLHVNSDVPFGAFLSGGIDSSTVVAYMSRVLKEPVQTFTIGYTEAKYDEREEAAFVANICHAKHRMEVVEPHAMSILPDLVRHYGEPFADSSAVPTWYVSRFARQHVKMVLSGDGGDESFAGYSSYPYIEWSHRRPASLQNSVRHLLGAVLRRVHLNPSLPSPPDTWFQGTTYFSASQREQLWSAPFRQLIPQTRKWFDQQIANAPQSDLTSQFQYFDLHNYLPFDNLTKVDIASMYHGLEVRVPLLDHVLLQKVATIPTRLKIHPIESLRRFDGDCHGSSPLERVSRKYILKRVAARFYPESFLHRKKKGFEVPVGPWLRQENSALRERLLNTTARFRELFNMSYVEVLMAEHRAGADHAWRLWSLLFLDEWFRQNPDVILPANG